MLNDHVYMIIYQKEIQTHYNKDLQSKYQDLYVIFPLTPFNYCQTIPPSRSTPYGFARLEITVKTVPTDGVISSRIAPLYVLDPESLPCDHTFDSTCLVHPPVH
jgi:hypothetical protein